jgi:hypothetical protein
MWQSGCTSGKIERCRLTPIIVVLIPQRVAPSILCLLLPLAALVSAEHLLEEVELRRDGEQERKEHDEERG